MDPREAQFAAEQAKANLMWARKPPERGKANLIATRASVVRSRAILDNTVSNRKRFEALFAEGAVAANQPDAAAMEADVAQASLSVSLTHRSSR